MSFTANEVALGELGCWPLKARRDLLRLKYWGNIVMMGDDRLVKIVRQGRGWIVE